MRVSLKFWFFRHYWWLLLLVSAIMIVVLGRNLERVITNSYYGLEHETALNPEPSK
jgi:hypothetical protein